MLVLGEVPAFVGGDGIQRTPVQVAHQRIAVGHAVVIGLAAVLHQRVLLIHALAGVEGDVGEGFVLGTGNRTGFGHTENQRVGVHPRTHRKVRRVAGNRIAVIGGRAGEAHRVIILRLIHRRVAVRHFVPGF
ncbi:hypothetical protein D3C86_1565730 [compost metagenome]